MHKIRLLAALLPLVAAAQTTRQTFPVIYASTDQDVNEIFTAIRTISDAEGALNSPREIAIDGTPDQLRTAEWVLRQLDQPADAPPASSPLRNIVDRYQEDTARVFHLPKALNPQEFNEVQTAVRTITDIRRVYPYVSRRTIVLRGSAEAVNAADWLIADLTGKPSDAELVFPKNPERKGEEDNRIRVFRLAPALDVQSFNEIQTMLRTLTDARRVYPYQGKRMIALRGTREQVDLSGWLVAQFAKDLPQQQQATSDDYTMASGEVVRVFYTPAATDQRSFVDRVKKIREASGVRRIGASVLARTFAARGTAAQIAQIAALSEQ